MVPAQQDVPPGKRRSLRTGGSGTATLRSLYGETTNAKPVGHFWVFDAGGSLKGDEDVALSGTAPLNVPCDTDVEFIDFQNNSNFVINLSFVPTAG